MKILTYPDPILRKKSVNIKKVDFFVKNLIYRMSRTLKASGGIGLSAPQVGKNINLFLINLDQKGPDKVIINPQIIRESAEKQNYKEGCLSFPGLYLSLESPESLRVMYYDKNMTVVEETLHGLEAVCFHHEYMHLQGVLIVDRNPPELPEEIRRLRMKWASEGNLNPENTEYLESLEKIIEL